MPRSVREPGASCGEETSIGSVFYSDRRVIDAEDGRSYLCSECQALAAARRRGRSLTDAELRRLAGGGSLAAITWHNPGPGGGTG